MPIATQLNLALDNDIGVLARLCRDLAHGGVNLLAISAPEKGREKGVVRLLVPNRELAAHVLTKAGYAFAAENVLFVELTNRPGALARAAEKLAARRHRRAVRVRDRLRAHEKDGRRNRRIARGRGNSTVASNPTLSPSL